LSDNAMRPHNVYKPRFYINLISNVLFVFMVMTAVTVTVIYTLTEHIQLPGSYTEIITSVAYFKLDVLKKSFLVYGLFTLLLLAGTALITVLYSHRVAGPLVRLGAATREIAVGNLGIDVKFRENDAVHDLADTLNEMASFYSERNERLIESAGALRAEALNLESALKRGDMDEAGNTMRLLGKRADEAEDIFSGMKL